MTEAVVAIPLLLLILSLSIFAARLYGRTLQARGDVRHAVWTYALNSCEGGAPGGAAVQESGEPLLDQVADERLVPPGTVPPPTEEDELFIDSARRSGESIDLGDSWGVARASFEGGTVQAQVLPMFRDPSRPARSTFSVRASFEVQCDEKPRGASPPEVLAFVFQSLPDTFNLQLW